MHQAKLQRFPIVPFFQEYQAWFLWGSLGHPRAPFSELLYVHLRCFKIKKSRQVAFDLLLSYWFVIHKQGRGKDVLPWHILPFPLRKLHPWPCPFALHSSASTTWHHLHFQTSTWQGGHRYPAVRVCKHSVCAVRNSQILLLYSLPEVFWYLSGGVTAVPTKSTQTSPPCCYCCSNWSWVAQTWRWRPDSF